MVCFSKKSSLQAERRLQVVRSCAWECCQPRSELYTQAGTSLMVDLRLFGPIIQEFWRLRDVEKKFHKLRCVWDGLLSQSVESRQSPGRSHFTSRVLLGCLTAARKHQWRRWRTVWDVFFLQPIRVHLRWMGRGARSLEGTELTHIPFSLSNRL